MAEPVFGIHYELMKPGDVRGTGHLRQSCALAVHHYLLQDSPFEKTSRDALDGDLFMRADESFGAQNSEASARRSPSGRSVELARPEDMYVSVARRRIYRR